MAFVLFPVGDNSPVKNKQMVNAALTLSETASISTAKLSIRRVFPITAAAISRIVPAGLFERLERGRIDQERNNRPG